MTAASDIKAGAAYVELYINNSALARGLKSAQRQLRGFSASVTNIGKRMMALSGVMATPFIAGVKVFADFEQQMANVSTMLDEPAKHMDRFKTSIRQMSVEFGESTATLAAGLYDILSASVPAEKALDVLAVSAKAAKAGLTDTGTAADAITTMLNAYGLSADKAGDVSDLLFIIVKRGKTTFAELAPSIGMVATTAATAGVSTEQLGAALATMTRNGVKTDNAITAVSAIISSFLKPTDEAAEYARSLGFEMSSATLQAEGLQGVFEKISHLPPDAISKLFPNVRALRGVLPALKNMEGFAGDLAAMASRAGATETAYAKMSKTLATSFARLKQAGLSVLSVIGEALADKVSKAAKAVMRFATWLQKLIQKNKSLLVSIAKTIVIVGGIGAALIAVGVVAKVMAIAFGGLSAIITLFTTAISIAGTVLAAICSPIGLVIAAVAALGATILVVSGAGSKALAWLGEKFRWLKDVASKAFKGIGDALAAGDIALAGRILWLSLKLVFQKGINSLYKLWMDFKKATLTVWVNLKAGVQKLWQELWFALKEIAIKTGITEPILKTFHALEYGWLKVTQFFSRVWIDLCSGILMAWNRVSKGIKAAQSWIAEKVVGVMAFFDDSIDEDAVKQAVRDSYQQEMDALDSEMSNLENEHIAKLNQLRKENAAEDKALEDKQASRLSELDRQKSLGNQGRLAEMRAAQDEIDKAAEAEKSAMSDQAASDLKDSAQALKDARDEWKAAIAKAAQKRGESEAGDDKPETDTSANIESLMKKIQSAGAGLSAATSKVDVQGSFNAMSIRALASAGATDAVANNTAEMVKQQKKTNQKLDQQKSSGVVFE
jgi:TP901 family phage tail tape measure protein